MILVLNNSEKAPDDCVDINVTSRSTTWSRELSPFLLKGGKTWTGDFAENVENLWQFTKVYDCHAKDNEPTQDYFKLMKKGWASKYAFRYPMGRDARPLYSYWNGKKFDYLEAKEKLYVRMYFRAVKDTEAFKKLKSIYEDCLLNNKTLVLRDFDAYNHVKLKLSPYEVLKHPTKKFGHGFVLMFMLLGLLDDKGIFIDKNNI